MHNQLVKHCERILGVEGGGTKTAWALVETVAPTGRDDPGWEFRILEQGKLQASNFRLTAARAFARDPCRTAEANRLRWSFPCRLRNSRRS